MRYTDEQIQMIRDAYANVCARDINLTELSARVGKLKSNICRKARALGLTNQRRAMIPAEEKVQRPRRRFATNEERRQFQSEKAKRYIKENGHPRGALGLRHSDETRRKQSAASLRSWADPTSGQHGPEAKQRRSEQMYKRIMAGQMRSGYSRSAGGKREDLGGMYFRSSWEANYARYLNWLVERGEISSWEYEPKTFEFVGIKRGTRFYTPDFRVIALNGSHEWHEVKGWMDAASKTRLKRMSKYFPEEKIVLVDEKWFRAAKRQGMTALIPNWETKGRGSRGC